MLLLQLPKAPEAAEALAEAARLKKKAEARAAYEADVAAVRELRMCLRDVATRLLTDRRWRSLALPVTPQEDAEYWQRVGPLMTADEAGFGTVLLCQMEAVVHTQLAQRISPAPVSISIMAAPQLRMCFQSSFCSCAATAGLPLHGCGQKPYSPWNKGVM